MDSRILLRTLLGLALSAVLALAPPLGWAQGVYDGSITGTVFLPDGDAVAGATARVTSDAIVAGERVVVSGEGGKFVFLRLPPGTYDLTVGMDGFKTFAQENIVITTGDIIDVRVDLEIGAVEETIVVSSISPILDARSSTIDTTFTDALLDVVPTNRNTFYDLTLTAPGMASVGADESWLPSASAYGSASSENIFLVDGVDTTNPRGASWGSLVQVNYNTVEEVKILSVGARAEYGSYSGAAVDVLTKSGGNEYHGDVAYYTMIGNAADNTPASGSFGADWLWAAEDAELVTIPEDQWEAAVTFGGPVIRDTLWFYAGFDRQEVVTNVPVRALHEEWEADLYDVKLTGEFGTSHRASLGYHSEDGFNGNNSWGDTWDDTMIYTGDRKNDTLSGQYQWVVSDRSILSAKYLGFDTQDNTMPVASTGRPGYINWWKLISDYVGVGGEFPYWDNYDGNRQTVQADFSHYADDFLGTHDVKIGVQYTRAESDFQGGYFHGYANFAYPANWSYYDAEWYYGSWDIYNNQYLTNPFLTVLEADSTGAFVDDTWVVGDRVTLNLGLRYDNMTSRYGEGAVYEYPETPGDIGSTDMIRTREGTDDIYDFKTWSPRLGIAWTITGDGKTVLRSHIGRYYPPLGTESLRRFGPDMEPYPLRVEWYHFEFTDVDTDGDGWIDADENRDATRMLANMTPYKIVDEGLHDPSWDLKVAPGTGSPYTDQFNISVQRQIGREFALELSYIYKKTEDILALVAYDPATGEDYQWEEVPYTTWTGQDTNIFQIVLEDYNGDGMEDFGDVVYVLNNLDYEARNISDVAGRDANRTYQGLQLVFNKRYSNRWQMLASLNWTDSDGVAPRTVDQDWYIDGPMIMDTPFGSSLNHFVNNLDGPLPMTPKFMFKLAGSYRIPVIETDFGLRVRYDSGRAIFPIEVVPIWEDWMQWEGGFDYPCPNCVLSTGSDRIVAADPNDADWLPSTTILDLSLNKTFRLGDFGDVSVAVDALNATNESSPNRVAYGQGDYGRVRNLVRPRMYRLGVKFSF